MIVKNKNENANLGNINIIKDALVDKNSSSYVNNQKNGSMNFSEKEANSYICDFKSP